MVLPSDTRFDKVIPRDADPLRSEKSIMAYTLPNFNLNCNAWDPGLIYTDAPSDTFFANLAPGRRVVLETIQLAGQPINVLDLLLVPKIHNFFPSETNNVDNFATFTIGTILEVPRLSGFCYMVSATTWMGRGFTNEHKLLILQKLTVNLIANCGVDPSFPPWPFQY